MVFPGYYIFLFSDVCGYTTIKIFNNDKRLITDLQKSYEEMCLDFVPYFRESKIDAAVLVSNMVDEHGVSVIDFTGDILEKEKYYSCDDIIKNGLLEVNLNAI